MSLGSFFGERKALKVILIILVVLAFAAIAFGLYYSSSDGTSKKQEKGKQKVAKQKEKPPPPPPDCSMCGVAATSEIATRQPLAIMIENSPKARPQSGLSQACLVAEALAEGGVTRFMAVYVHGDSEEVGPVRSARSYYLQLALGFDALYAHCGGSKYAMAEIKSWKVMDLDQFYHSRPYWRVRFRRSPHNLYTSTAKLREEAQRLGYSKRGYRDYKHKKEEPLEKRSVAQNLTINFSYPAYRVQYQYNRDLNAYLRFQGGNPHIDKINGVHIQPKNVVVVYAPTSPIPGGGSCLDISLLGSGRCQVIRDGGIIEGVWRKSGLNSPLLFYDAQGKEISFNPGQIWLEVVKLDTAVTHQSQPPPAPRGN